MFKIYKGGDTFFQWDIGQRLIVEDPEVDKVHFCNKTKDCSLVCNVYEEDGLRLVNVPNILLQDTYMIRAFACLVEGEENYFAKNMQVFKVIARTKPEDYVYTEEELKNFNSVEERINIRLEELEAEHELNGFYTPHIDEEGYLSWTASKEAMPEVPIVNIKGEKGEDGTATDEQVSAWLEAHPEATTSVLDGSITEAKFTDELKTHAIKDYVTPQMYGAKGDGVTDDTTAIQEAINNASVIYFPKGTYCVSRTITVPSNRKITGEFATITCKTSGVEAVFATAENSTMIVFENLRIVGNMDLEEQGVGTTIGIYFNHNSHYISLRDLTLEKHNYALKEYDTVYLINFTNIRALYCNNAFVFSTEGEKTTFTMIECEAECCGNAYKFRNLTYGNLMSCGADYCNMPTNNPYGKGYGNSATGNGIYHFHNCRGVTISGCGTEYSYGQGAIYANASDLVVNNFKCCGAKTQFKPNFTSFPNYHVGIITTGTERTRLVLNNIIDDGFTDEYIPTVYPTRKTPIVAYNYAEGTYGAHKQYDVTVNGLIGERTLCNGQGGSGYCLHINSLKQQVSTTKVKLGSRMIYAPKSLSSNSYTKLVLPFKSNTVANYPFLVRVDFMEYTGTTSFFKCYTCEFTTAVYQSCGVPTVISKNNENLTVTNKGLNIEITLPTTPATAIVAIEVVGFNPGLFDYDNVALA